MQLSAGLSLQNDFQSLFSETYRLSVGSRLVFFYTAIFAQNKMKSKPLVGFMEVSEGDLSLMKKWGAMTIAYKSGRTDISELDHNLL